MQATKTFPRTQAGMQQAMAFYKSCTGDASLSVGAKDDVISVRYTESKPNAEHNGRKIHLFANHGVVCQKSKMGAALAGRGEHIAYKIEEFKNVPVEQRCSKCNSSKLFAFLNK